MVVYWKYSASGSTKAYFFVALSDSTQKRNENFYHGTSF